MPYFGNIIGGMAWIIDTVLTLYLWLVIISALLSFVNPDPYNQIVILLRNATQPVFGYVRRYLPFVIIGGFDLSPIVIILAIQFLKFAVVRNLLYFSGSLLR